MSESLPSAVPSSSHSQLAALSLRRRYSSGRHDLIREFFEPCLEASVSYDRATGFFASSVFVLVGVPVADFALRGGHMRLVCSPRLTGDDIHAIEEGYQQRQAGESVLGDLERILEDPVGGAAVRLLATLVSVGAMDVRLALRSDPAEGLFHDKVGIFTDLEENRVTFTGSANETWSAWSGQGNHEYFHAFSSWKDADRERVRDDSEYFESLWEGREEGLAVVPFPDVARERLEDLAHPEGPTVAEEQLRIAVDVAGRPPRPTLRAHQSSAVASWESLGHRGILEHATGSGKTITALACIDHALRSGKRTVVLVPSRTLLRQWHHETSAYFGSEAETLLVGGGHTEWRVGSLLRDFLTTGYGRIVIATMDTAASEDFVGRITDIAGLLVIADEVHRIGSTHRRRVLSTDSEWRLGLSATWEREGDPEGTAAISEYFGSVLEPRYGIRDAITDGYLCEYRYFVHEVELDADERDLWAEMSAAVSRSLAMNDGEMTDAVRHLLIRRARIVKKARGKVELASQVLGRHYQDGDAWLLYCDDSAQLREVRGAVEERGLHCFEYHTNMVGDSLAALEEFSRSGGIMLSINCLDEGVDIPRISHALILASSTTRREFIQRRGRVLRKHESKHRAAVHDVLVTPGGFDEPASASFLRTELARAREFLGSATDSAATAVILRRLARDGGLDPGDLGSGMGLESDDVEDGESG